MSSEKPPAIREAQNSGEARIPPRFFLPTMRTWWYAAPTCDCDITLNHPRWAYCIWDFCDVPPCFGPASDFSHRLGRRVASPRVASPDGSLSTDIPAPARRQMPQLQLEGYFSRYELLAGARRTEETRSSVQLGPGAPQGGDGAGCRIAI